MLLIQHKTSISRLLLTALALLWLSQSSVADESSENNEHPTLPNWYQVEVVLFDQRIILGDEQAPKEVNLEFPSLWTELHNNYQNVGIMRRPLFDKFSESSLSEPRQGSLLDRIYTYLGIPHFRYISENQSDIALVPEARIPYQADNAAKPQTIFIDQPSEFDFSDENFVEIAISENPAPIDFKPIFEAPFRTLGKSERNLNDTARALNRRNYTVLFHQAWRFEITSKQQSQWILLKAGDQKSGRFSIEGALRFYKSRFLHFEADLWRLIFADDSQAEITLPEIPKKTMTSEETVLVNAMKFSSDYLALNPKPIKTPSFTQSMLNAYNLDSIMPLYNGSYRNIETDSIGQQNNAYPIQAIWPIKQSKRIQEEDVYYIDHPQMGALVTIKSYEPIPINMPPQPDIKKEQAREEGN
jgi:hypothetical protein